MKLAALRRQVAAAQAATAAAIPLAYLAMMVAGVFLFVVDLVLLVVVFDIVLFLQAWSSVSPRRTTRAPGLPRPERGALEAADLCFARFLRAEAAVSVGGFMAFGYGLDLWARSQLVGAPAGPAVLALAVVAVVLIGAGRHVASRAAWTSFASAHPEVWASQEGLAGGRNTSSAARYVEWRERLQEPGAAD